jgi:hypothetical protein
MQSIVHDVISALERAMGEAKPETTSIDADLLRGMAAAIGVTLSDERATALVPQAEPHFALLRALDGVAEPATEPAAEFHLDNWAGCAGV